MTCVICKSELVEDMKSRPDIGWGVKEITGYSICPKCRIVYKEEE